MKKIFYLIAVSLCAGMVSCKGYLDINTDPNSPDPQSITNSMIFPGAEMNVTASYNNLLHSFAGYHVQYFAQDFGTSNYMDFSKFNMSAARYGSIYTQLYQRGLNNFQTIAVRSKATEEWGSFLAATCMRAFIYQILVDANGEVPYSEALNSANLTPKYDEGIDVYKGLIAELNEALSHVDGSESVCTNFLFPGKTSAAWIPFAKALKLKLYMRMGAGDMDEYKKDLKALVAEADFPESDVAYVGCWGTASGQENPFYAEEFSTSGGSTQVNLCANIAIVGTMQIKDAEGEVVYQDGRLPMFFEPNANGDFTGAISGSNFSTSNSYKQSYWCRPVASYDMPAYLLTCGEVELFLAEYEQRYGSASVAKDHYEAAVRASFATADADGAEEAIAFRPYDAANWRQVIGVEKWVSLCGVSAFEAWCEARRLGYPAFNEKVQGTDLYNDADDSSYAPQKYVPGTFYTPINVYNQIGANTLIQRYPYAEQSANRNPNAPEFPGMTTPVFWAAK